MSDQPKIDFDRMWTSDEPEIVPPQIVVDAVAEAMARTFDASREESSCLGGCPPDVHPAFFGDCWEINFEPGPWAANMAERVEFIIREEVKRRTAVSREAIRVDRRQVDSQATRQALRHQLDALDGELMGVWRYEIETLLDALDRSESGRAAS